MAEYPFYAFYAQVVFCDFFYGQVGKRNFFHQFREKIKKQKEIITKLVDYTDDLSVKLYLEEKEKLNEILL